MPSNYIINKIVENSKRSPDKHAVYARGKYYSYREFTRIANSIKQNIVASGYNKEEIIGVLSGDDVYTYASIIAILAVGAAYVPINENNPADRNLTIINDTKLKLVLASKYHDALIKAHSDASYELNIFYTQEMQESEFDLIADDVSLNQMFYLLFTSGSTGKPKGVPIYHENINSFMLTMLDKNNYDFNENDRFMQMFQLSFDMSVVSFFTPLCLGACCYIVPTKGVIYLNILKTLDENNITVAFMVPSVLSYIERFFSELRLEAMRYCIFAGESLIHRLVEGWSKCVPNSIIHNSYGPSEATIICTVFDWSINISSEDISNGVLTFGKMFKNTNAAIVDNDLNHVPNGEIGELCLWGDQVTNSYWNNAEKSKQVFIKPNTLGIDEIAYLTGDLCYINSHGNYIYCGRKDFQIKIDGHRIELEEIEHLTREYTQVNLVAVVPTKDDQDKVYLKLYIEGEEADSDQLLKFLAGKLPAYMVPRDVNFMSKLPLNLNGKIDRKKLAEL